MLKSCEVASSVFDTGVSQAPKMFCKNATRKTPQASPKCEELETCCFSLVFRNPCLAWMCCGLEDQHATEAVEVLSVPACDKLHVRIWWYNSAATT